MSTPPKAKPIGFWQVPPEVWSDEQALDDFAQRVSDHMTAANERAEVELEGEETQDS